MRLSIHPPRQAKKDLCELDQYDGGTGAGREDGRKVRKRACRICAHRVARRVLGATRRKLTHKRAVPALVLTMRLDERTCEATVLMN